MAALMFLFDVIKTPIADCRGFRMKSFKFQGGYSFTDAQTVTSL